MENTIKIDDLEKTISKLTGDYARQLSKEVDKGLKEAAYHAAGTLKKGGPYKEHKGDYTPSWYVTKTKSEDPTIENPVYVVHNRRAAHLAHLIEKGHVGRDGKRVKPFVHIEPVDSKAQEWALENVKKAINKVNGSV